MKRLVFLAMIFFTACNNSSSPSKEEQAPETTNIDGEQLFRINCSQCHKSGQDFIGPDLKGVETRWKDKDLLYAFVRNSQEVIATDPYAKALFMKWKQAYMQPFPQLTDKDIDAILAYGQPSK
jgi:mono/diheme cytochrome c family protein